MDDDELDRLMEAEASDRLTRVLSDAQEQLLRLERSLFSLADALDGLASATDPASPDQRRDAFRRQECPGLF